MSHFSQEQVAAIWARLNALGCELQALSDDASRNILRRNAGQLNREYEQRSAELRREQAELRGRLPAEGMATNQRLVLGRFLGTVILRESDPEEPPDDGFDATDPWERFEREVGISGDHR